MRHVLMMPRRCRSWSIRSAALAACHTLVVPRHRGVSVALSMMVKRHQSGKTDENYRKARLPAGPDTGKVEAGWRLAAPAMIPAIVSSFGAPGPRCSSRYAAPSASVDVPRPV